MLSNGESAIIISVKVELLAEPQTTYNFEVRDYHTYYVAQDINSDICAFVVVHNVCTNDIHKRLSDSPNFNSDFKATQKTTYAKMNNSGLQGELNQIDPGRWSKAYQNGFYALLQKSIKSSCFWVEVRCWVGRIGETIDMKRQIIVEDEKLLDEFLAIFSIGLICCLEKGTISPKRAEEWLFSPSIAYSLKSLKKMKIGLPLIKALKHASELEPCHGSDYYEAYEGEVCDKFMEIVKKSTKKTM